MNKISITIILTTMLITALIISSLAQGKDTGEVITTALESQILKDNRIGLQTKRTIKVYLPPGYAKSKKAYPVVYFLHNTYWSADKVFEDGNMQRLLEKAFSNNVTHPFIMVAADYSTSNIGSIYENSPTTGRWLDFTVKELLPFIDSHFRTLPHRDSRAVTGDFFGGRGALKMAIAYPDVFGVVYAMHPVATGQGSLPWKQLQIDWMKIHNAHSISEVEEDPRALIFLTICQGFLPNPNRGPFYCDFFVELKENELKFDAANAEKIKQGFLLDQNLELVADHLRTMRGIAFDWARFDPTQEHVISNRNFSMKLEDLSIEHEAEEYNGTPWNKNWTPDGRFYSRVLPFFNKHLIF